MAKSINSSRRKVIRSSRTLLQRSGTIGMDLGDRFSRYCAVAKSGEILIEERVATTPGAMALEFKGIGAKLIAIETGTHSPWVSRLLKSFGHRVIVANSRKLRLIYENKRKDDRVDAQYLARLARLDPQLLKGVRHRGEAAQAHLELLRARDTLVATRTCLANHVRGVIKPFGVRLPSCRPASLPKRIAEVPIPEALQIALAPLFATIHAISEHINDYDHRIEKLAADQYPDSALLRQVQGVGALTATAFMLTVDDPNRFKHSRAVGPWLGLTPARDDSGQQQPQKSISKEGDHYIRRLLVLSAQYILGPFGSDSDLRRHGLAIAARGGKNAKKRAVVAVARKLAVLLHRLWVTRATYEPLRCHPGAIAA